MTDLQRNNHAFTAFQLHKHEHKYSVVHFTVLRNTEFEEDVKSKVFFTFMNTLSCFTDLAI